MKNFIKIILFSAFGVLAFANSSFASFVIPNIVTSVSDVITVDFPSQEGVNVYSSTNNTPLLILDYYGGPSHSFSFNTFSLPSTESLRIMTYAMPQNGALCATNLENFNDCPFTGLTTIELIPPVQQTATGFAGSSGIDLILGGMSRIGIYILIILALLLFFGMALLGFRYGYKTLYYVLNNK